MKVVWMYDATHLTLSSNQRRLVMVKVLTKMLLLSLELRFCSVSTDKLIYHIILILIG
jgi:hypothetical protein